MKGCTDFEYAGEMLSDYGMMLCSFDSGGGIETVSSGADVTFNQIKPIGSNRFNLYSSTYDTALSATFQICKNPCRLKNQEEMRLSFEEVSAIQRWLCRKDGYKRFKLDKEGYEHVYWNGTFSSKQIVLNDAIIGLELTLYTDAPFAFMDEVSTEYECSADTSFNLWDNSDETTDLNNSLRPDMEITILSEGNFKLTNSMDTKSFIVRNCKFGEVITIDGKNQLITSSLSSHNLANDFNYFFPRIINTYEERCNTFMPNLDCKIKITYSPIRKVGI